MGERKPGLGARRSLGQNFLKDHTAVERIAALCANVSPATLVEIGPGKGALTERLVGLAPRTCLVEKDRRFVALHRERYEDRTDVSVLEADAARADYAELVGDGRPAVAVGNLPYNAASPIYYRLLAQRAPFARFVLMFQREVAERLVASPGTKAYGAPSVATAAFTQARIAVRLPPGAFAPPPKVHSAVVAFDVRPEPAWPIEDEAAFLRFVRELFQLRRKTLSNVLTKRALTGDRPVADALAEADVDPRARAETLPPETVWRLWRACGGR